MEVPRSIAQAASARIRQATEERQRVLKATASGRPLDAEPNQARKVRRIQAATGVGSREAAPRLRPRPPYTAAGPGLGHAGARHAG